MPCAHVCVSAQLFWVLLHAGPGICGGPLQDGEDQMEVAGCAGFCCWVPWWRLLRGGHAFSPPSCLSSPLSSAHLASALVLPLLAQREDALRSLGHLSGPAQGKHCSYCSTQFGDQGVEWWGRVGGLSFHAGSSSGKLCSHGLVPQFTHP